MKKIAFHILLLFLATPLWAETTSIPEQFPSLGRGIRPLGMGNAFLTMEGDDHNAIFYNPASLADNKGDRIKLISPNLDYNIKIIKTVKDVLDLSDNLDKETTDGGKTRKFDEFFDKHVGEFNSINLFLPLFGVRSKFFTIHTLVDSRTTISMRNRAFPNFELKTRNDGGVVVGSGYGFLNNDLQVGAAVKVLYRIGIEEIITINEILANKLGDQIGLKKWGKGIGVGGDIGFKYKVPDFGIYALDWLNPTVAATYQDIGKTRFSGSAPDTPQSVSAGIGFHPKLGWVELSVVADFREINQKVDFLRKLHAGVEARFRRLAFITPSIRGGVNQGYPTTGATLDMPVVDVDFAFFGEELGKVKSQKGFYRFATSLNFNF